MQKQTTATDLSARCWSWMRDGYAHLASLIRAAYARHEQRVLELRVYDVRRVDPVEAVLPRQTSHATETRSEVVWPVFSLVSNRLKWLAGLYRAHENRLIALRAYQRRRA